MQAGTGCQGFGDPSGPANDNSVFCPTNDFDRIQATLDQGDDEFSMGDLSFPAPADGGGGDDEITTGRGPDTVTGGPGDDVVDASGLAADAIQLTANGGDGDDTLIGGGAADLLNGNDGAQYTYCHGQPGTQAVAIGDRVTVGQYILDSASTGNSTGPHLHFGIRIDGQDLCPQSLFVSIVEGQPLDPHGLPTSGCSY